MRVVLRSPGTTNASIRRHQYKLPAFRWAVWPSDWRLAQAQCVEPGLPFLLGIRERHGSTEYMRQRCRACEYCSLNEVHLRIYGLGFRRTDSQRGNSPQRTQASQYTDPPLSVPREWEAPVTSWSCGAPLGPHVPRHPDWPVPACRVTASIPASTQVHPRTRPGTGRDNLKGPSCPGLTHSPASPTCSYISFIRGYEVCGCIAEQRGRAARCRGAFHPI